jgi:hypothetical protein
MCGFDFDGQSTGLQKSPVPFGTGDFCRCWRSYGCESKCEVVRNPKQLTVVSDVRHDAAVDKGSLVEGLQRLPTSVQGAAAEDKFHGRRPWSCRTLSSGPSRRRAASGGNAAVASWRFTPHIEERACTGPFQQPFLSDPSSRPHDRYSPLRAPYRMASILIQATTPPGVRCDSPLSPIPHH